MSAEATVPPLHFRPEGWFAAPLSMWPRHVRLLEQDGLPWTDADVAADVRWHQEMGIALPGRPTLRRRWRWTDLFVRRMLAALGSWSAPLRNARPLLRIRRAASILWHWGTRKKVPRDPGQIQVPSIPTQQNSRSPIEKDPASAPTRAPARLSSAPEDLDRDRSGSAPGDSSIPPAWVAGDLANDLGRQLSVASRTPDQEGASRLLAGGRHNTAMRKMLAFLTRPKELTEADQDRDRAEWVSSWTQAEAKSRAAGYSDEQKSRLVHRLLDPDETLISEILQRCHHSNAGVGEGLRLHGLPRCPWGVRPRDVKRGLRRAALELAGLGWGALPPEAG